MSGWAEGDDEDDFLPSGFLPTANAREETSEQYSFLDNLEADLHADVEAGHAFLKDLYPKSESSCDLLADSSVFRSVLQDKRISENGSTFNASRTKLVENDKIMRLQADKTKLVTDLQKLELELSLEKREKHTVIEHLERENHNIRLALQEEKIKSDRTIQDLQSQLELHQKQTIKTLGEMNHQILSLEVQQQQMSEDAQHIQEAKDNTATTKLQELEVSIDTKHSAENELLVSEMPSLRLENQQADSEAANYKGMLEDKRTDLGATIRSLQRRMEAFKQERDELELSCFHERQKFEETYHKLLVCQRLRDELLEASKSFDEQRLVDKSTIEQLRTTLAVKQAIIDNLLTPAVKPMNDEGLQAEVDFLQEALEEEVQQNDLKIQTLQSQLTKTANAFERERKLREALSEKYKDGQEHVDRTCQELESIELVRYKDKCLEQEHAMIEHKKYILELQDVKQRLQVSDDAKMKLNESLTQLEARVHSVKKRFRRKTMENARIAREAVDSMHAMFKDCFDRQNTVLEKKQNQLDVSRMENSGLRNDLQETREDLDNVLDIEDEPDDALIELTTTIQEFHRRYEASLLKSKQDSDLMEQDLLEALEREDEAQEAHDTIMKSMQERLAETSKLHLEAMREVNVLRTELEILRENRLEWCYSVMDLTDLFRSCQDFFAKLPASPHTDRCQVLSGTVRVAPEAASDESDLKIDLRRQHLESTKGKGYEQSDRSVTPRAESSAFSRIEPPASKRGVADKRCSLLPLPIRTTKMLHRTQQNRINSGPKALPRKSDLLQKESSLSGYSKRDTDVRNRDNKAQSGILYTSDSSSKKRLSLSVTAGSGSRSELTNKLLGIPRQTTSINPILTAAKTSRSQLDSYRLKQSSIAQSSHVSLLQQQQKKSSKVSLLKQPQVNFRTPNKEDLSKKLDGLSRLSSLELRSRARSTHLKFSDNIVEIMSPESPLVTP
jgi:hypothetical protein